MSNTLKTTALLAAMTLRPVAFERPPTRDSHRPTGAVPPGDMRPKVERAAAPLSNNPEAGAPPEAAAPGRPAPAPRFSLRERGSCFKPNGCFLSAIP